VGIGFSDADGFLINGGIKTENLRGTGNTASLSAQTNDYEKSIAASYTDPYFTDDGISRTFSLYYRKTDRQIRHGTGFDVDTLGGAMTFNIPITEYMMVRAGLGVERNKITSTLNDDGTPGVSDEVFDFVEKNGKSATT